MNGDIEDLQVRMAFQEDMIANLSDQLALRDRDIKDLQAQLRQLHAKLLEVTSELDGGASPLHERPPHY